MTNEIIILPQIIASSDYHEFSNILNILKQLGLKKIKFCEVEFKNGFYNAIFFTKKDDDYFKLKEKYNEE